MYSVYIPVTTNSNSPTTISMISKVPCVINKVINSYASTKSPL
nr:MAG TPA_asm: hypothetical protein [Caudoviricetes sp.]